MRYTTDRCNERVEMGGHGISETTILRRYLRELTNFFDLYSGMVDGWRFYENTSELRLLASGPNSQGAFDRLKYYRSQSHG